MTHDQHVVPQVYLKNFANGKTCYVVDSYGKISSKSIEGICYEKDYYELRDSEGVIVHENLFESGLYQKIETMYSSFMKDLLEALDTDCVAGFMKHDDNDERLTIWLVSMLLRNPIVFTLTPEVAKVLDIDWNDNQCRNNAILNSAELLEAMSKNLHKTHKTVFLKNMTDIGFLTGNYPSIIMRYEDGEIRGYMPISPQYYVLLIDKNIKCLKEYSVLPAENTIVDHFNKGIINNTIHIKTDVKHTYIISKDKNTLEHYFGYIQKQLKKESQ